MDIGEKIIHSGDVQNVNCCNRVLAGPGAGKTFWITGQIKQILRSGILHSTNKIACITYTNKAAQNIGERIGDGCNNLEVCTIHSFLYKNVVKPFFHLISDEEEFAIENLDGHEDDIIIGYKILHEIMPKNKKFLLKGFNDYSKLKTFIEHHNWHLEDTQITLTSQENNYSPLKGFNTDVVVLYKKYVWKEYGLMHHDDVLYFSYKLLQKYPSIINLIASKFPFILIDEYQDTNSIQHFIFQKLADSGAKVTIIGDKAQSIYRFAGSDINNITSFTAPDLQCYRIEDNRRSTQSILNFLNVIRTDLPQKSLLSEDYGVPVIMLGEAKDNYIKANEMCNGQKLVSLSWTNDTANTLKYKLSLSNESGLINKLLYSTQDSKRAKFTYHNLLAVENATSTLMKDSIKYISKAYYLNKNDIDDKQKALYILLTILDRSSEYRDGSLADFYQIANSLNPNPLPKLTKGADADFFSKDYMSFAKDTKSMDDDSLHLTIHKAKGSEFDNVILVFDNSTKAYNFLCNADLNKPNDDDRLYYVACSRPRYRLFISIPSLKDKEIDMVKTIYNDKLSFYTKKNTMV